MAGPSTWPTGLVCKKCGRMFGMLIEPAAGKISSVHSGEVVAMCSACAGAAAKAKGIVPNTPEKWAQVLRGPSG
jgi:hypothetical protein